MLIRNKIIHCKCYRFLLSTVFLHMLTEIRESLEAASSSISGFLSEDINYPLAELLVCSGFLIIMAVECIAHKFVSHSEDTERDESFSEDSPDRIKVKLPRVSGLTPSTNLAFEDDVYAPATPRHLRVPPAVSPYFSNEKKVLK